MILGFDTSTAATAACLLDGERSWEAEPPVARLHDRPGHAAELMPAIARVMDDAGAGWTDLSGIAVGIGPGTFTGLRIGVATARALARARGLPLHPVLSVAALAAGIEDDRRLALIDARRGEVYGAYAEGAGGVGDPFALAPDALGERFQGALAAGDGSIRFREILTSSGIRVAPDDSRAHVVRALHVCRLASAVPATPPEAVLPCYLRAPDAKPPSRSAA